MKKYLSIAVLFLLSACAAPITVDNAEIAAPTYDPVLPPQIDVKDAHWHIITNVQLQALAKTNDPNIVLYALNPDDFKGVLLTLQDADRYIQENNSLILYYRGTNASASAPGTPPASGQ